MEEFLPINTFVVRHEKDHLVTIDLFDWIVRGFTW